MTKSKMKAAILRMVRERGNRTFVELGAIEGFKGDKTLLADGHHIILWKECSQLAAEVLVEMFRGDELRFDAVSPFIYLMHGNALVMPIADDVGPYDRPHWMPVLLNLPRK